MKWTKLRRSSGLIEWVCEHGVGHPDYESAKEIAEKYNHDITTWTIHGCCSERCCCRNNFPGKKKREKPDMTDWDNPKCESIYLSKVKKPYKFFNKLKRKEK